jgi:hypothetical protein
MGRQDRIFSRRYFPIFILLPKKHCWRFGLNWSEYLKKLAMTSKTKFCRTGHEMSAMARNEFEAASRTPPRRMSPKARNGIPTRKRRFSTGIVILE